MRKRPAMAVLGSPVGKTRTRDLSITSQTGQTSHRIKGRKQTSVTGKRRVTCMSPVLRCLRNRRPSTIVLRKLDRPVFSSDAPRRRMGSPSTPTGDRLRLVGVGGSALPDSTKPPRLSSTLRSRSLTTWSSSSSLRSDVSDSRMVAFCRTCDARPYGTL